MKCEAEKRGYRKVLVTNDVYGWPVGSTVWLDNRTRNECWNSDCTKYWFHSIGESIEYVDIAPMTAIEHLRKACELFLESGNDRAALDVLGVVIDHE